MAGQASGLPAVPCKDGHRFCSVIRFSPPEPLRQLSKKLRANYFGTNLTFSSFSPRKPHSQVLSAARRAMPHPDSRRDAENQTLMPKIMEFRIVES